MSVAVVKTFEYSDIYQAYSDSDLDYRQAARKWLVTRYGFLTKFLNCYRIDTHSGQYGEGLQEELDPVPYMTREEAFSAYRRLVPMDKDREIEDLRRHHNEHSAIWSVDLYADDHKSVIHRHVIELPDEYVAIEFKLMVG